MRPSPKVSKVVSSLLTTTDHHDGHKEAKRPEGAEDDSQHDEEAELEEEDNDCKDKNDGTENGCDASREHADAHSHECVSSSGIASQAVAFSVCVSHMNNVVDTISQSEKLAIETISKQESPQPHENRHTDAFNQRKSPAHPHN